MSLPMAISAKVSSLAQPVSLSTEHTLGSTLSLSESSNVALDLSPDAIASYSRDGSDLVIRMTDGETLRISNFYVEGQPPSRLYLVNAEDELLLVELGPVSSEGFMAASYASEEVAAGFESLTAAGAAAGGGLGTTGMLVAGGLAVAGGAAAVGSNGGGGGNGDGPPPAQPASATPPSNVSLSSDGRTITGRADPGSTVELDTDGDGVADYTALVDANGQFTINVLQPLNNGEQLQLRVRLANGSLSNPTTLSAPDDIAPLRPSNLQVSTDGSQVTGRAEPGSTVSIDINGDGQPDASVVVGPGGQFVIPLSPPLSNGETITVVARDVAGNTSPSVSLAAPDTTPPPPPVLDASNGNIVTGTAEVGASVVIVVVGNAAVSVPVDANGNWSYTPSSPIPDGTTITATARDQAGNSSPSVSVEVTSNIPNPPVVIVANGNEISGTAQPGAMIEIRNANGVLIAPAVQVGVDGRWSTAPAGLSADTPIKVVAIDLGAQSAPANLTLDVTPPDVSVISHTANQLSGTAEPGSSVQVSVGGNTLGVVVTDSQGNWNFLLSPAQPDGAQVSITARDTAGNVSFPLTTTIDAQPPAAPTVASITASSISGTAEPGSVVRLVDDNGRVLGELNVGSSGAWSFTPTQPLAEGTEVTVTARDSAGNTSPSTTVRVDTTAPDVPTVEPSNGTVFTGTAEPGSSVTITGPGGAPVGQATADVNGDWSITPSPALPDGTQVSVVVRDPSGNASSPVTVTVDLTPPPAPVIQPGNGSEISGTAEPGSTVTINTGGAPLSTVADSNGNWSVTVAPPLANGTVINATATDAAGNVSGPSANVTTDSTLPDRPTVNPSNGSTLSGTAVFGESVVLTDGSGNPIATVTVDNAGNWSYTPASPLADGTHVVAVARDSSGNLSAPTQVVVDAVPPPAAQIDASNGTQLSGTAEANGTVLISGPGINVQVTAGVDGKWIYNAGPGLPIADGATVSVTVRDASGNTSPLTTTVIDAAPPAAPVVAASNGTLLSGTAEAGTQVILSTVPGGQLAIVNTDANGRWSYAPQPPLDNGTQVSAVARDAVGNTSTSGGTTIDAQPPAAPQISPSNGSEVRGTGEIGATITLTNASGTLIGTTVVDSGGNWSFTPTPVLAHGTLVRATATDAAGNLGPAASTTVDSIAPSAPTIDPSNGATLSGTAEPNSTVRLVDGNNDLIGNAATDAFGNWTFPVTPSALPNGTLVSAVAIDAAGNTSQPVSTTTDNVAPSQPAVTASNATSIAGTADADSTVVLTLPNGSVVDVAVDASGNWSYSPNPPLADGAQVSVAARDEAGNQAGPVTITIDAQPPAPPSVAPSNGTLLEGTTEANSVILISIGNAAPILVTPGPGGAWSYTPNPPLAEGTQITIVARDEAGNLSTPVSPLIETTAPSVTLELSNGSVLTGLTEAGASVAISVGGSLVDTVTAGPDGRWTYTPTPALANNSAISVVATDAAGNASTPATGTTDNQAPNVSIEPTNGVTLTGLTEAFASVTISSGGVVLATVGADNAGNWNYTPTTPLANNAQVSVIAQDATGNASAPATTTVDSQPPAPPTINPSNGTEVVGRAEANSTINLTFSTGATAGPISVNGNGDWSYTPTPALPDGTTISAVASDAVGNTSQSASTVVDAIPPPSPVVLPSSGTSINGTAEANSTITLSVDGVPLPGTVTVDANGYWQLNNIGPLADNALIEAWATDAAGNVSVAPGTATVDADLPDPPVIAPSRGNIITGTAEANSTVELTINGASVLVSVDGAGAWSHIPTTPLGDGVQVSAVVIDASSNRSSPATLVIDAMPPAIPVAEAANATTVIGTGEIGSTVVVRLGATVLGSATVGADGKWTITIAAQANGTPLVVEARDSLGNTSNFTVVVVDAVAPPLPTIQATNGTLLSGTAEANSTVILSVGGVQVGTTTVDGAGNWSFTASPPLSGGSTVEVVARDASGNIGPAASTIVDATPPPAPVVNPSNGVTLSGTAEIGSTVILMVGGVQIGTAPTDGAGNWTFTPSPRLTDGVKVDIKAQDGVGNIGATTSVTVDAVAPNAPIINPSNGIVVSGTAEVGSRVIIRDQSNQVIADLTADANGNWSFSPLVPLVNGSALSVTATDASGNVSTTSNAVVDAQAPQPPTGQISANGTLLTGIAEANSQVSILIGGSGTPIVVTAASNGTFTVPLSPALTGGQSVQISATDTAGNTSTAAQVQAPNLTPPNITVAEAADTFINAAEISDGIQVQVGLQPGMRAGDSVTLTFRGQGGFTFTQTHVVTAAEVLAGSFSATLTPSGGNEAYPQGAATVTAHVNNAVEGAPVSFVIDTIPPATPVLSLAGSLLSISADPGVALTISVNVGGVTATQTVAANNAGIASLNLLTGLNIGLTWDQLISAQIGVSARDPAGNPSNVAQIGLGAGNNLQPVTVGNFAVDASLNPLSPKLGVTGTTAANASLIIEVISPALNVTLSPIVANASGQFSLNLLSPSVLSQLGLSLSGLLNLGPDLQLRITSTSQGKQSASYLVDLDPLGVLGLTIGAITVTGSAIDDILSGTASSAERIIAGTGNDLILNVGSNDRVEAGSGNDTIQITATNFTSIDGGSGFDTLLFSGGIDINFNSLPLGAIANIERIDLGSGDAGSTITLTAAQVDAMTDGGNTLQITGEANDIVQVSGAVFQNSQLIDGIRYQVYQFGSTTLQIEENTVQVVV